MNNLIKDKHGVRAFFDMFGRDLGNGEERFFCDVFEVGGNVVEEKVEGKKEGVVEGKDFMGKICPANFAHSTRKWRQAIRVAKLLQIFPWIEGVAASNTLAMLCVHKNSDIDFFVLCKSGRVWLSRFFVNVVLKFLRLRPGEAKKDPVCPCFFVSRDAYNLSKIALPKGDSYLHFWLATLTPIWQVRESFDDFFAANIWALKREYKIQHQIGFWAKVLRGVFKIFDFNVFEKISRWIQNKKFSKQILELSKEPNSAIVINNSMLKFHKNDRRAQYHNVWTKKSSQNI